MNTPTMYRYVRAMRAAASNDDAVRLLAAAITEANDWPVELTAIEELPDWQFGTLVSYACKAINVKGINADAIQGLAEYLLLGNIARAAVQALGAGDVLTAQRMAAIANQTMTRVRGGAALMAALATPVDADATDGTDGDCE